MPSISSSSQEEVGQSHLSRRFVRVIRVPACARVYRVSRLPPVSFLYQGKGRNPPLD